MKITYKLSSTVKYGNQPAELEDAACPAQDVASDAGTFTCAVADGATQGSHSGPWARALCDELVRAGDTLADAALDLEPVVAAARQSFLAWEKAYLADRASQGRPLQWFEAEVIGSGAFSTLVGLHVQIGNAGAIFHAVAVGDSCLFVVRGGQITASFPLTEAGQFAGAPLLIASQAASNATMQAAVQRFHGELQPGDSVLLCTDALAHWALREKERGEDPAAGLIALLAGDEATRHAALVSFLAGKRRDKQIRNDDVTLAQLTLEH